MNDTSKQYPYQLLVEEDGIKQVEVYKAGPVGNVLVWAFPLEGDDESTVLAAFYAAEKFLVVSWNGWIRAFDVQQKQQIFERKPEGDRDTKALLSADKTNLFVAYSNGSTQFLSILSLQNFAEINTLPLPFLNPVFLQLRKDGCLLFYYLKKQRSVQAKGWKHGYYVLNPETAQLDQFEMEHPQKERFEMAVPFLNPAKDIGVMPYWGDVEVQETAHEETIYIFKVLLFDLHTFEVIRTLPVRAFTLTQLEYYESECEEMAEAFSGEERGREYEEALATFCQNLNSISFPENEDAFWLCWRGGILRKVGFDRTLSPLLVASSVPRSSASGPFQFPAFHAQLDRIEKDRLIFREHDDYYTLSLAGIDLSSKEPYLAVSLEGISKEALLEIDSTSVKAEYREERGKVLIEVEDLRQAESYHHALDQMVSLTEDIAYLGLGNQLAFLVKDKKGQTMDDSSFFKLAISKKEAAEKAEQLIRNFVQYPNARRLYIDSEKTALCYAVFELAKFSAEYLPSVILYLSVIDEEHDVFNKEELLPMLAKRYKNTDQGALFLENLQEIAEGYWAEAYDL